MPDATQQRLRNEERTMREQRSGSMNGRCMCGDPECASCGTAQETRSEGRIREGGGGTDAAVKRWHLFGGYVYYPSGGIGDYLGSFATREEAERAAEDSRDDWTEIAYTLDDGSLTDALPDPLPSEWDAVPHTESTDTGDEG